MNIFLAAEQEFLRMPQESLTADDLRSWGVLYHYMTLYCAPLAHSKLTHAMEHPDASEDVRCSAALQRLALMGDMGKGQEAADQCDRLLSEDPSVPRQRRGFPPVREGIGQGAHRSGAS